MDQVPSYEMPSFMENSSHGDQIWFLQLVPRNQTGLNLWDKSLQLVPSNILSPFVKTVRRTSPCDQMKN